MAAGRGRTRRVSLPGVAELLRPAARGPDGGDQRLASGRERHTQKITVYQTPQGMSPLGGAVTLDVDGNARTLLLGDIAKALVQIEFNRRKQEPEEA